MKRLLVAFILILNATAYADTPAHVRIRVKLPFEPTSPSAVVLPVGTRVTVLWPQDDKLMIRYRRVEGLVPAVTVAYVPSEHPGDVRQYRPEPVAEETEKPVSRVESAANTYHEPVNASAASGSLAAGLPLNKILMGAVAAVVVLFIASRDRKSSDNDGPMLRRQS